jgi:hypothetical protein
MIDVKSLNGLSFTSSIHCVKERPLHDTLSLLCKQCKPDDDHKNWPKLVVVDIENI